MRNKLTEDQALEIYQSILYGDSQKSIAAQYGSSSSFVCDIARGKAWGYVTGLKISPTIEALANGVPFSVIPQYPQHYITIEGVVIGRLHGKAYLKAVRIDEEGYKRTNLPWRESTRLAYIHRLLCFTFKADSYFEDAVVRHLDGNRLNNDLANLKWGTIQENSDDMILHGTSLRGEKNHKAILTENDVKEVRNMYKEGVTRKDIADHFRVNRPVVESIVRGMSWTWLT